MKTFKKNQQIFAKLPTGREVEGFYIEPYGANGHTFYVLEFNGIGKGGEPQYKKVRYGVQDEFISAMPKDESKVSTMQYKAWLKRAMDLEVRINEIEKNIYSSTDDKEKEKLKKKLDRNNKKLKELNAKIEEYEGK